MIGRPGNLQCLIGSWTGERIFRYSHASYVDWEGLEWPNVGNRGPLVAGPGGLQDHMVGL